MGYLSTFRPSGSVEGERTSAHPRLCPPSDPPASRCNDASPASLDSSPPSASFPYDAKVGVIYGRFSSSSSSSLYLPFLPPYTHICCHSFSWPLIAHRRSGGRYECAGRVIGPPTWVPTWAEKESGCAFSRPQHHSTLCVSFPTHPLPFPARATAPLLPLSTARGVFGDGEPLFYCISLPRGLVPAWSPLIPDQTTTDNTPGIASQHNYRAASDRRATKSALRGLEPSPQSGGGPPLASPHTYIAPLLSRPVLCSRPPHHPPPTSTTYMSQARDRTHTTAQIPRREERGERHLKSMKKRSRRRGATWRAN